jgi:8-amino-7-oxononanoate synthase
MLPEPKPPSFIIHPFIVHWLDDELDDWTRRGLRRALPTHDPALLNFASNDYLSLASDPRVIDAACRAARDHGWGAAASPLVSGWRAPHATLAEALAEFEHAEAALLFPTGFAANLGVITALVGRGDAVYLDRLAHASLVAGARLSGASVRVFPHNDAAALAQILGRERGRFRRVLVATEGLFSMDGDLAPLDELLLTCENVDAILLVDEAHATGVLGADGRGATSMFGVASERLVRVGTLSKSLGSIGGFVVGERRLIDHVLQHAPTFIFSTSLPPAAAAAAHEALRIVHAEPQRRETLLRNARRLRGLLATPGLDTSPIVPVHVGTAQAAVERSRVLEAAGFLVPAIRPPTVPRGTARLRISVSALHTEADIDRLAFSLGSSV